MIKKWLMLTLLLLLVSGCQTALYSGLNEREGNEMLSLLLKNNIPASKVVVKDNKIDLMVESDSIAQAIDILTINGYPQEKFPSVADLFPKDGLIASPLEEKARLIYAKSQDIAKSISQIDGVISARVHLVFPQKEDRENIGSDASASIFIKHFSNAQMDKYIPKIKLLVNNSVPDLSYDRVSVVLFPSELYGLSNDSSDTIISHLKSSKTRLIVFLSIIIIIALMLQYLSYLWYQKKMNAIKYKKS